MNVDRASKEISFGVARGDRIAEVNGTKAQRGPARCPFCREPTSEGDLRRAAVDGKMGERMIAVVVDRQGAKDYRPVEDVDLDAVVAARDITVDAPGEYIVPEVNGPAALPDAGSHRSINLELYGFVRWGQLFNHRQLIALNQFVESFHGARRAIADQVHDPAYRHALEVYLALWISRLAARGNSFCRWFPGREAIQSPFSGQSIPMMWDYPEVNPFSNSPAGAERQLARMRDVLLREQADAHAVAARASLSSATERVLPEDSCDCVVTDPPYGDYVAYADLSDFFYVWLKRMLGDVLPEVFRTPQTPKDQEITSHRHRHSGSRDTANAFYQRLLTAGFEEAKRAVRRPKILSVMFAHQSTEAWTALLTALFRAGFCPDATWPIATEMPNAALGLGTASLETSVTVACRPRIAGAAASFGTVRKEIADAVRASVHRFWSYGFRGADLIVACYGPAVGVFGKYDRVEKADGTPVGIPELLELAKQAARDAIAGEFRGDNLSTLYYVWANLYGAAEQAWDDARLVVQIGGSEDNAMEVARGHGIFVVDGSKCRLALLADRADRRGLGIAQSPPHIDALHRSMLLWKEEKRGDLVSYLGERELLEDGPFWKLAQALFEVLPRDLEDWKLVSALLSERQTLRTEGKRTAYRGEQRELSLDDGGEDRS